MATTTSLDSRQHVVVLGGGFAGLEVVRRLRHAAVRVTLIERENHHLFQPLLYQVATGSLAMPDIAQPLRAILAKQGNATVLLDEVTALALADHAVTTKRETITCDWLVLALGGVTSYFGNDRWAEHALGLKSLDDAVAIRARALEAFEQAEQEDDPQRRSELMTAVVIGGGPTGVEMAGSLEELFHRTMRGDFRRIDPRKARVVLIEAGPRLLAAFSEASSASAAEQLRGMRVEVKTGTKVLDITHNLVRTSDGEIRAATIVWAAGVMANPLTRACGAELDRAGRIKVGPDLSVPGHPQVFAIGDLAACTDVAGVVVPGVAPAAQQMGRFVAGIIAREGKPLGRGGDPGPRGAFRYRDKGSMATIGRFHAVAQVGRLRFSGFIAWLAWLFIHLLFIVDLRSRLSVLFQWFYAYITNRRGVRVYTSGSRRGRPPV